MALWWGIAAAVLTRSSSVADADAIAQQTWRTTVFALAWTEVGLWGICCLVKSGLSMVRCCAGRALALEAVDAPNTPTNAGYERSSEGYIPPPTAPAAFAPDQQQFIARAV